MGRASRPIPLYSEPARQFCCESLPPSSRTLSSSPPAAGMMVRGALTDQSRVDTQRNPPLRHHELFWTINSREWLFSAMHNLGTETFDSTKACLNSETTLSDCYTWVNGSLPALTRNLGHQFSNATNGGCDVGLAVSHYVINGWHWQSGLTPNHDTF